MSANLPAITGKQLIRLLISDGWEEKRRARHGVALSKTIGGRTRVTVVPDTRASLPQGTLGNILCPLQTGLGRKGLSYLLGQ